MRDQRVINLSFVAQGIPPLDPTVAAGTIPAGDRITRLSYDIRMTSARLLDAYGRPPKRAFFRILGFTAPSLEYGDRTSGGGGRYLLNAPRQGSVRILVRGWANLNHGSLVISQNNEEVAYAHTMTIPMNKALNGDCIYELDANALSNAATVELEAIGQQNEFAYTPANFVPQPARFINDDALNLQLVLLYDDAGSSWA